MKGLKGSAFITSIILVALLVVALSTATFAWFSANNVVNVSSISFIAQTRDKGAAPGDLQIAWEPNPNQDSYIIEFAQPGDSGIYLAPLMPLEAPVIGATRCKNALGDEIFAQSFTQGVQDNDKYIGNGLIYSPTSQDIAPYLCVGKEPNQTNFYLINRNVQWGQQIKVEYSITGELADKLCIAIFIEDVLRFVLSNSDKIYYGAIAKDTLVSNTAHVDLAAISKNATAYIPPNSAVKVTMYAWYNGVKMTDNDVYKDSILNELQFKGEPVR
ncbi:MAG: hypothetical protein GX242_02435 [Clostridiales bacterium]|nr:hypothetical protein [Clostridiales bacterium]